MSVSGGANLMFTTANWNTPQTVTLSAVEDADVVNGQAIFTVASAGLVSQTVTATEADNDVLGLVVTPTAVTVAEGGAANFTVKLSAQPSASVSVTTIRSSGDADLSVSGGATLTFTTANWNSSQAVTLSAAEAGRGQWNCYFLRFLDRAPDGERGGDRGGQRHDGAGSDANGGDC